MPERIDQPTSPPSPAPWSPPPGRILSEPGTVQQCRADYDAAAGVRHRMDQQDARARR